MKVIRRAPITVILVAINMIMMIILEARSGGQAANAMMELGAAYTPSIIEGKEYYRLFTSMFLHFDFEHLLSNMLLLFFLGEIIEEALGKIRYLIVYLVGGVVGNIVSLVMDLSLSKAVMPISAGASGAVFALIGAMAWMLIVNRGRMAGVTIGRLSMLIALSVWDGFRNPNIDGAAHVGGLVAGFVLALILYRKPKTNDYYVGNIVQGDNDEDNMHNSW